MDYYRLLGVARDAEPEVIAAAYKALARKYHPDTGGESASKEQLQALNEAYSVLSDPGTRSDYDRQFESSAGTNWRGGSSCLCHSIKSRRHVHG
ncbi:MAG: hypothetical protein EON59_10270 [Alphaproteobacteria bacterium]|nr:MAG: hypothetical protein EON59_10270 [Alphaproteobacteria bacterium]